MLSSGPSPSVVPPKDSFPIPSSSVASNSPSSFTIDISPVPSALLTFPTLSSDSFFLPPAATMS
eukprot:CAMPEP_0184357934 /NCGR_PEP_ID=MMETSP1089-20130417/111681_1 /TAXON_ID=38269 ORGANISM="Gloeochaete wittrockiana, Strain SAG46.84" /NCGR_SAMPLE_ID=MMETSP1089 /ASSEMBLY_ACC=CAM_ASM_000445 /LENGTH=63 /DNA_ID=CAMNT_0026695991 /DNA_START=210 /DNA_END=398 /DNA_ORIENTATION=+